jgi:hypothetical protein
LTWTLSIWLLLVVVAGAAEITAILRVVAVLVAIGLPWRENSQAVEHLLNLHLALQHLLSIL